MLGVDTTTSSSLLSKQRSTLSSWLRSWELPLILTVIAAIAGFLRFYQISTAEFDEDQAMLFRLAQDAVHHGLLPATSNAASIGIANPPGAIYLFMPIALFSTNPVWGTILVGVSTTVAAILTYLFTRRYYGLLAGCIAALLYATAAKPLIYARFIWRRATHADSTTHSDCRCDRIGGPNRESPCRASVHPASFTSSIAPASSTR